MDEKAKVVGMMPVDDRVQDVARAIIDDVVEIQGAVSALSLNRAGMAALRNIQMQARALLTGKPAPAQPVVEIAGGYRLDVLDVVAGLSEAVCCDRAGAMSDEDLRIIAMAAEVAHNRINNYLLVKRMENLMRRQGMEGAADGMVDPAA